MEAEVTDESLHLFLGYAARERRLDREDVPTDAREREWSLEDLLIATTPPAALP